jgi:hypothetical protein
MTNNKFKTKFLKILREAPELEIDPTLERDAAEASLDDDVSMDDYDVDMEPDPNAVDEIGDAVARQNEQMATIIDKWNVNIEKFLNYINGDQPNSLQSVLANANPESVLGNLKNQQYKIGRIASDLAALQQAFLTAKKSQ